MEKFNLTPIENEGKRVLTTAQLAEAYETDSKVISKNFNRNREHYTEGKHFYCLTGDELKVFFANVNLTNANSEKIRTIYLWTEKGALLHAKSLNTDRAWEVYDFLVENYFQKKAPDYSALSPQLQFLIQMEQRQNALEKKQEEFEKRQKSMEIRQDILQDDIELCRKREFINGYKAAQRLGTKEQADFRRIVHLKAHILCGSKEEVYQKIGKMVIADIYRAVRQKFGVKSYADIRMLDFSDAVEFVADYKSDSETENEVMRI